MNQKLNDLWDRFQALRVWSNYGQRAPHKPLLALWAIGRCLNGHPRMASYELVEGELTKLLRRFGPFRTTTHAEHPFWRMRNDAMWEIDRPFLVNTTSSGDALVSSLREHDIQGGLLEQDYNVLRENHSLALQVAGSLVDAHFPGTRHDEILRATGIYPDSSYQGAFQEIPVHLDDFVQFRRRKRDPAFRWKVLDAYERRCAVCALAIRVDDDPDAVFALDAAHIRWHEAHGPASVENGLALCALHHRLFDAGTFTVLPDLGVFVAKMASGPGCDEWLARFHGQPLCVVPSDKLDRPAPRFLSWHLREVFRSPDEIG